MGETRDTCRVWWGNLSERDYLENPDVDGRIILKNIHEVEWGAWSGLIWLRIGTGGGTFKRSNEPSGSMKCWEFLEHLRIGKLLKKGSVQ